ncbi:hypothetical protein Acr_00g0093950 [Actinidia rufa]|uniref:Uncharacterized protein n=1 Tax=Actinidia rufa TaxID=165716 RepID=A0A7J0DY95_9ERIC|nr:hypothetical protein Acr_00g0093950 [Actinidia rufa]
MHIRILLWNNMEVKISKSLVFLTVAKGVWDGTKERYSRLDNLRRTYEFHKTLFSHTLKDISLEDYYARFGSVCQELDLNEPLLGSKELPSLSEVFSRLHQAYHSSPPSISANRDHSIFVSSVGGSHSSNLGPSCGPSSFGHGRGSSGHGPGSSSGKGGGRAPVYSVFGYSGGHDRHPRKCTYSH